MSIDLRTRTDSTPVDVDLPSLFGEQLPAAFAHAGHLLDGLDDPGRRPLRPLVVVTPVGTWTLQHRSGRIEVTRGAGGSPGERRVVVDLTAQQVADLVVDQITPIGLMTSGDLVLSEGRIGHLLDWWLVLRAVLDGQPLHRVGSVTVRSDLDRSFRLNDDPAEMRAFLEDAGFLHLQGVFDPGEMEAISRDMDAATDRYQRGDGRSWWADLADGSERLVRMQGFDLHSEAASRLLDDPRFVGLGDIAGCGHTHRGLEQNRVEALFKPVGVTQGISDVPWHKDCSLGRHSYQCCTLTVGVSVTGAGPRSGQLRVIAGSHRARVWPSLLDVSEVGLPEVALPTETGDVTVHLSCTLHMAQPPVDRERRVLYTSFGLPTPDPEATRAATNRLLATAREHAPLNTSQSAAGAT